MSTVSLSPQCADVLAHLKSGPRTSLQLRKATGVMALTTRIHELRIALAASGQLIETRLIEVRNRHGERCHVAEYTLRRKPRARRPTTKGRAQAKKARA